MPKFKKNPNPIMKKQAFGEAKSPFKMKMKSYGKGKSPIKFFGAIGGATRGAARGVFGMRNRRRNPQNPQNPNPQNPNPQNPTNVAQGAGAGAPNMMPQ